MKFIIPEIWSGGGPRNIYILSKHLEDSGYHASVVAFADAYMFSTGKSKPDLSEVNVRLLGDPLASVNYAIIAAAFRISFFIPVQLIASTLSLMTITEPALYIATAWETVYPVLRLSAMEGTPCFYFTQAYEVSFSQSIIRKYFSHSTYRSPLIRFTQSAWLKSFLDRNYEGKTYYIGMGIDHDTFHPNEDKLLQNKPRILTIARAAKDKGFNVFVEAIRHLRRLRKDFDVIIIGERKALASQRIDFPYKYEGWIANDSELANLYRGSIFVNTGIQEALPMPPLEAMACGATVVMTDMNGSKEYTIDHHNCLLAPVGDPKSIAYKIDEVLSSESLREDLSRNAVHTAGRYKWHFVVERFESMLKKEGIL